MAWRVSVSVTLRGFVVRRSCSPTVVPAGPVMRATSALADWPAVGAPLTLDDHLSRHDPGAGGGGPGKTLVTVSRPDLTSTATPMPV